MMLLIPQAIDILPQADPLPIPAPPFIFIFLMFLTFVLHMVAMNFTVGGTLLQVVNSFGGGRNMNTFGRFLTGFLPISMSFTVTLGIAPLLFVQVLYGQIFFTTSVLMGWVWLFLLVALMIAYYSLYYYMYNHEKSALARKGSPLLALVLLVMIAVIFVMNFKLFFMKDRWEEIYRSGNGLFLNFEHAQVWPSILHYLVAMVAFGGLLMVIHGWTKVKSNPEYSQWAARFGGLLFAIPTALQFLFGTLLLLVLPKDLISAFMTGNQYATVVLFAGMILTLLAVITMLIVAVKRSYGVLALAGILFAALIIVFMTMVRGFIRDVMVSGMVDLDGFQVESQMVNMLLFGVLLVAGLATVGWMLWKVALGHKEKTEETAA